MLLFSDEETVLKILYFLDREMGTSNEEKKQHCHKSIKLFFMRHIMMHETNFHQLICRILYYKMLEIAFVQ